MKVKDNSKHITLSDLFRKEKKLLILTGITGIIYNIGMTAGPLFEGQLAQYLFDILKGIRTGRDIVLLSLAYVAVIGIVQTARALKRLFVRKFANNVSRSLKESIYHHLVHESMAEMRHEDLGTLMTKAAADADDCAEGMRKFTTEIYDTGVVMIAYLVMLLRLDWRLTLIVILFPPIAYGASAALKKKVTESVSTSRRAMGELNSASVDAAEHALTYRIYGEEKNREKAYEKQLSQYEKANRTAGIWQNSPQPLYQMISLIGVIPILYFGGKNVLQTGWTIWTIASFSSYLSCFTKLAAKSSHAAKLFNAVQKAQVSWNRIKTYLDDETTDKNEPLPIAAPAALSMQNVCFQYEDSSFSLHDLNMHAKPGQIIGITGKVASGKSTFGRLFLHEYPYEGKIIYGAKDLKDIHEMVFACTEHDPCLFTGTVKDNITFGNKDEVRLQQVLKEVQIDKEVQPLSQAGKEGSGLSGGQQARIALARALYTKAPVLILDDPFASVDKETEVKIYEALRKYENKRIILLISHRMDLFPDLDQILFLENGTLIQGNHSELMKLESYASLYRLQEKGGSGNA